MHVHVATYATIADLDDLRDSVRDADLEFICSYPTCAASTRDAVLVTALDALRTDYIDMSDLDDDQTTPIEMPTDITLEIADADPTKPFTYNVHLRDNFYGIIRVNVFEI